MFTGIIESMGQVKEIFSTGSNKTFWIASPLSGSFSVDQSIAHNGVCLTVEEINEGMHRVTAVEETLKKTTLGSWEPGSLINLERSMMPGSRLDGHFVQGHVDARARCKKIREKNGSHELEFRFPRKFAALVIEKGSISLNGISLTLFDVKKDAFKVAIIPYSFEHTNLHRLKEGDEVNLEFDMIGKYIARKLSLEE
ncbi:MAG TPA: riboflavin synthase [Flavisolibacter sp.]